MDKQIIKKLIIEKQKAIPEFFIIRREIQFDTHANYVLVGLRRAGKSFMMYQDAQNMMKSPGLTQENILYINFEDERLSDISSDSLGEILDAYFELYPEKKPLIYLDEIQVVYGWEKFARRLADSKYRVMITGSNAKMLSSEIATTLGGRYIPKEVFPFSFREYLEYKGIELDRNWIYDQGACSQISNTFDHYFTNGGLAESFNLEDKREYLNSLCQKILLGDIVERNKVRNARAFRLLTRKLADSVMQPSSLSRLKHIIDSSGDSISLPILKDYLEYLEESYLFFSIPNMSSSISEQSTIRKRYIVDNGLLNLFLFSGETKLLENIVACKLIRKYRNTPEETLVYYYNKNVEIDFCIPSAKMAIQVSYGLGDDATYRRETGALEKFLNVYPDFTAIVITRDNEQTIDINGHHINVMPIWKWLCLEYCTQAVHFYYRIRTQ